MNSKFDRRDFFRKSTQAGMAGCLLLISPSLLAAENLGHLDNQEALDPKKLNYCGYKCPDNCQFLEASVKNDPDLKKKAYDTWQVKERYGADFEADKIYCFGCKNKEKPEGVILKGCGVRKCAIEKGFDCCIECKDLKECKQDLWTRFPDFKNQVIKMQQQYMEAKG